MDGETVAGTTLDVEERTCGAEFVGGVAKAGGAEIVPPESIFRGGVDKAEERLVEGSAGFDAEDEDTCSGGRLRRSEVCTVRGGMSASG